MERQLIINGNPLERQAGCSRAVRVGPFISVGATAPVDRHGQTVGIGNAAKQARQCLDIIDAALRAAGSGLEDVVRTRFLLTDINVWPEVMAVRKDYLGPAAPVDTVVEVGRFVNPEWLIEVEADAVVADSRDGSGSSGSAGEYAGLAGR
jgi:enamine deaminase RidA (YjgF/YER057c/UK114 family)